VTRETAKEPWLEPPDHAVVSQVGQRVTERRELPVEHGDDPWLARVKDHVIEPEVAVHDARLVVRGDTLG
jgi:hypothetical protein